MRWIVGVLTMLCVLGVPRTQDRALHDDAVAQLTQHKQLTACAYARRFTTHDTNLGAFTVVEAVEFADRPDPTCEDFDHTVVEIPRSRPRAALSRGPPRG